MTDQSPDIASLIALVTAVITLACAIAQGPLKDFGWVTSASRLLSLSERFEANDEEGSARAFLRELAVSRVMRAKRLRDALSSGLPWTLNKIAVAALVVMAALCVVMIVQTWSGGVHVVISYAYVFALLVMCACSAASVIALSVQKRAAKKRRRLRSRDPKKEI